MPAVFLFSDEVGKPHPQHKSNLFVVGAIYVEGADHVAKEFGKIRNSFRCHQEFHYCEAGTVNRNVLAEWLKIWKQANGKSVVIVADKQDIDLVRHYGCQWSTQVELISRALHIAHSHTQKPLVAILDDFSSRNGFNIEKEVKKLAGADICNGVLRLHSHANDLIQFADLVTGAINFSADGGILDSSNRRHKVKKEVAKMIFRSFGYNQKNVLQACSPSLTIEHLLIKAVATK